VPNGEPSRSGWRDQNGPGSPGSLRSRSSPSSPAPAVESPVLKIGLRTASGISCPPGGTQLRRLFRQVLPLLGRHAYLPSIPFSARSFLAGLAAGGGGPTPASPLIRSHGLPVQEAPDHASGGRSEPHQRSSGHLVGARTVQGLAETQAATERPRVTIPAARRAKRRACGSHRTPR
jgi:hypothetical protein